MSKSVTKDLQHSLVAHANRGIMRFSFVSMCPFRAFVSDLDTITSCLSRADWPSGPLRDVAWVLSVTLVRTESETMKTETMRAALTATATKAAALRRRSSRAGNSSPLLTFFPSGSRGRRVAWSRRLGGCLEPRNRGEEPECVEGTGCGRRLRLSRESRRLPISRGPQSLPAVTPSHFDQNLINDPAPRLL